ncbi:hypothetical protein RCH09_001350 [Actimicrobium sp. GrIS 1.19]|nr:hypothetical protein [Actimicrobium sp. GrIS 1.19]
MRILIDAHGSEGMIDQGAHAPFFIADGIPNCRTRNPH